MIAFQPVMPPTLLSVGVILLGFSSVLVYGEINHRLVSKDNIFAYYPPESEDVQSSLEQEQKQQQQYHHPNSPVSLNPQHDNSPQNDFRSSETSLNTNGLYPMPLPRPESKESDSLLSSLHDSLRVGLLKQNEEEDGVDDLESGDLREMNLVNDFGPLNKRKGPEQQGSVALSNRVRVLRPNAKERYRRLRPGGPQSSSRATQEIKRERTNSDATLSVDSSLNVLRQLLLNKLRQHHRQDLQRQIEENNQILERLGKRALGNSS